MVHIGLDRSCLKQFAGIIDVDTGYPGATHRAR